MLIQLHKQATTTPKIRAVIQASAEPASVLAERYGITEQIVYKWRHRSTVLDRSHKPHRLQNTLTPAQEPAGVARRPARGSARGPEPRCFALGAGPLPAAAWGG